MRVPEFKWSVTRVNAGILKQPILKASKHTEVVL